MWHVHDVREAVHLLLGVLVQLLVHTSGAGERLVDVGIIAAILQEEEGRNSDHKTHTPVSNTLVLLLNGGCTGYRYI